MASGFNWTDWKGDFTAGRQHARTIEDAAYDFKRALDSLETAATNAQTMGVTADLSPKIAAVEHAYERFDLALAEGAEWTGAA